jgi:peptidoglycan-associated lipoprotein
MKNSTLASFALVAVFAVAGCHKKQPVKAAPPAASPTPVASSRGDEAVRRGLPEPHADTKLGIAYFEYQSATLSDEARATLTQDAEILRASNAHIRIEGHADERGSTQYNLALGERRATAVKTYLLTLGISPSRLETISYGKERPAVEGHDEAAWRANRRVEIHLPAGSPGVSSR